MGRDAEKIWMVPAGILGLGVVLVIIGFFIASNLLDKPIQKAEATYGPVANKFVVAALAGDTAAMSELAKPASKDGSRSADFSKFSQSLVAKVGREAKVETAKVMADDNNQGAHIVFSKVTGINGGTVTIVAVTEIDGKILVTDAKLND